MRFKIGDLVTGNSKNRYGFTNKNAIMKVLDVSSQQELGYSPQISVQIFKVKEEFREMYEKQQMMDTIFFVDAEFFSKVAKKIKL
jgi:hypothetical protein